MSRTNTPPSMLAKPSSGSSTSLPTEFFQPFRAEAEASVDKDPQALLEKIRDLITDHLPIARQLAAEAVVYFPKHNGIQNADRILNRGRSQVGTSGPEAGRDDEIEWLQNPPDSVRGQWVALIGAELVGSAKTLAELVEFLHSRNLEKKALVHRIDA